MKFSNTFQKSAGKMKAFVVSLLCLCLSLAAQAGPSTYYIDCSRSSNGDGTLATPFWGVSATKGNNTNDNLNWATIDTDNADVLFKSATACDNSQLGGTAGFPSTTNRNGAAGDHIRIGVYDSTGAEITTPTTAQMVRFVGDGAARTEMISLFGYTYVDVTGIDCSGGSNSSGRGCIAVGVGAAPSSNITINYSRVTQGSTPTNTANMYGISMTGTSSGATDTTTTVDHATISGLMCSNNDSSSVTNSTIDMTAFSGATKAGVLVISSTDGRATLVGSTITGNTITGGTHGIRYAPSGATTRPSSRASFFFLASRRSRSRSSVHASPPAPRCARETSRASACR